MFRCPACRSEVKKWEPGPGGRPNASCPNCKSLERHRFLTLVLRGLRLYVGTAAAVLEYAPQPQIQKILKNLLGPRGSYVGIDLMDDRFVDSKADACRLPFTDDSFDMLVQFHVLEHIPDDLTAMREMARVLKPGGLALVQVPHRMGVLTDEDIDASPQESAIRFGQSDHVRYYGSDFEERLRTSGFDVTYKTAADIVSAKQRKTLNILDADPLWICRPV